MFDPFPILDLYLSLSKHDLFLKKVGNTRNQQDEGKDTPSNGKQYGFRSISSSFQHDVLKITNCRIHKFIT